MTPSISLSDGFYLLDTLATAVLWLDRDLTIIYMNTATEQLFGISPRKCIGQRLPEVITVPEALVTRFEGAITENQVYSDRQVVVEAKGGELITVDCTLSPYALPSGDDGLLLEFTAIDLPLRIARDQAMNTQQEHARSLLRGLAHEIKNPLGGLRGAAQLLERQLDDVELKDYTSVIIQEADRLQGLIDRMLGPVSRPQQELVNVHEVLEHVLKITVAGAPGTVEFRRDYDPSIPELISDRDRLVQVVLNIVGNALQAVGEHGTITFRTRVLSNHTIGAQRHRLVAALEIVDNGPGVPEHLREQIFYPMVTGTDHGTGLGLSIAQSMMNQLGGFIDFRSEPGHTSFTVLTPLELG